MHIIKETFFKISPSFLYIFSFLACNLCFLAIWEHPLIGDDRHLIWNLEQTGSIPSFILDMYRNHSGNLLHILIWGIFLGSEVLINISKILTIPLFLIMTVSAYYLATGSVPSFERRKF